MTGPLTDHPSAVPVVLEVWARPGASEPRIYWDPWRKRWTVAVRARAQEGEANRELLELLARRLGVPSASLELVGGATSRAKRLRLRGLSLEEVRRRLEQGT